MQRNVESAGPFYQGLNWFESREEHPKTRRELALVRIHSHGETTVPFRAFHLVFLTNGVSGNVPRVALLIDRSNCRFVAGTRFDLVSRALLIYTIYSPSRGQKNFAISIQVQAR